MVQVVVLVTVGAGTVHVAGQTARSSTDNIIDANTNGTNNIINNIANNSKGRRSICAVVIAVVVVDSGNKPVIWMAAIPTSSCNRMCKATVMAGALLVVTTCTSTHSLHCFNGHVGAVVVWCVCRLVCFCLVSDATTSRRDTRFTARPWWTTATGGCTGSSGCCHVKQCTITTTTTVVAGGISGDHSVSTITGQRQIEIDMANATCNCCRSNS